MSIKLKDMINESTPGFTDRKFGDPLPTLASVQKAHQEKRPLKEASQDVQSKMVKAIPMGYHYKKLAQDVAGIIHDEYGSHNVKPFLAELKKALNNYNM
tara:strand:+ start:259 stop:555 length:297 start_codon:yes stop_codon:yes gene_type:complete